MITQLKVLLYKYVPRLISLLICEPLVSSNLSFEKKVREVTLQRERDRQRQLQQIHVDRQVQNSKDLEAMEKFRQGLLLPTGRCSSENYETVAMQKCISISSLKAFSKFNTVTVLKLLTVK